MDLELALAIVDEAWEGASYGVVGTADVWEALEFLGALGIERDTLEWFWSSCFAENDIGRHQNVNAARNRIRYLLSGLGNPRGPWRQTRSAFRSDRRPPGGASGPK